MINDEIRFRDILRNYNIVKITELKHKQGSLFYAYEKIEDRHTSAFPNFLLNFNRAFSLYSDIIQNSEINPIKFTFLCENVIVNLITAIEEYLRSAFMIIAYKNTIEDLFFRYGENGFKEPKAVYKFNKQIRKLRANIRLSYDNIDLLRNVKLYALLPFHLQLSFQEKDIVRCAFQLLNIDLSNLFPILWKKIFSNEPSSYIKLRNTIIHSGARGSLFGPEIDLSTVESCYRDIAEFIYSIDKQLMEDFPD